jgi:hypothetical protein
MIVAPGVTVSLRGCAASLPTYRKWERELKQNEQRMAHSKPSVTHHPGLLCYASSRLHIGATSFARRY